MRLLILHPRNWTDKAMWPDGVEVRHVSIGGKVPRRSSGMVSYDGIGEMVEPEGVEELRDTFEKWQPDFFMFGIHHGFSRSMLTRVRHKSPRTKIIQFYTDQRPSISKFVKEHIGQLDMLLVSNRDAKDHAMYERRDVAKVVRTFYDGVCPAEYWPKPMVSKHECFFGGNNFWVLSKEMERKKMNTAPWIKKFSGAKLRDTFLREVSTRFDLEVRGEWGWNDFPQEVKRPMFHPDYLDAMRNSKIILNTVNMPKHGLLTRRFFRSIASGRLFVSEYVAGLEKTFTNHKHMVWFKTVEEGLDLIRYYLDHESKREKIARDGRAEVVKNCTWEIRLHNLVDLLRETFNVA